MAEVTVLGRSGPRARVVVPIAVRAVGERFDRAERESADCAAFRSVRGIALGALLGTGCWIAAALGMHAIWSWFAG